MSDSNPPYFSITTSEGAPEHRQPARPARGIPELPPVPYAQRSHIPPPPFEPTEEAIGAILDDFLSSYTFREIAQRAGATVEQFSRWMSTPAIERRLQGLEKAIRRRLRVGMARDMLEMQEMTDRLEKRAAEMAAARKSLPRRFTSADYLGPVQRGGLSSAPPPP